MSLPHSPEKYNFPSLFKAAELLENLGRGGAIDPPDLVILCFQSNLKSHVMKKYKPVSLKSGPFHLKIPSGTGGKMGVSFVPAYGAPAAVICLEELAACGIKRFVSLGSAGTLQKHVSIGDRIVCSKALRDEGTSYHYIRPEPFAYPSEKLTGLLEQALKSRNLPYHKGPAWTTDAPYRETAGEVLRYQSEGILSVDMEASALFAAAAFHQVEMASLFVVSDNLSELKWRPAFHAPEVTEGLCKLFDLVVESF